MPGRNLLKRMVFLLALIPVAPLLLMSWLEKYLTSSELLFTLMSQSLAVVPGYPGVVLRSAFYFGTLNACSWESHVGFGSLFTHRGATLARHASMGAYCVIGHADIGERVMMGSRISIPSGKRQHFDDEGQLTRESRFGRVSVGADCWIGEGAILLADVGARCIVSAGAIVIDAIPSDSVAGGNPARVLKTLQDGTTPAAGI